jgi:tetratricopeptide (TPR) repeat protein
MTIPSGDLLGVQPTAHAEPDALEDAWIAFLEEYEDALRRGEADTPREWLLGPAQPPRQLRERLAELYWLYRGGDGGVASALAASSSPPVVPGYEIQAELAHGGMGVVYKARQLGADREVALKMIREGAYAGPEEVDRFRREPQAIARLQHPHIVQVYEVGEHEGRLYFSMEYVGGGSLDKKLAEKPLPVQEAARLVETLARAMEAAHRCGIVHRDLKPANILLTADGTPKITDFGLAKRLDVDLGQTASGALVGTPSYMAPEQAAGKAKELSPRTDVWALGVILYEALTGRPPFQAASVLDTLAQIRSQEPVPPSQLQPSVPRDLETICLKCLQKDPARRYASAQDLADDLGRFLAGKPILARPVGPWERAWRWCHRNPRVAILATAVGLLLVVVAGVSTAAAFWFAAARRAEAEGREKVEQGLRDSLAAVDRYYTQVSESPELKASGNDELRRDLLRSAQQFYQQFIEERGYDPRLRVELANAHFRLAALTATIDSSTEAVPLHEAALELYQSLAREHPSEPEYANRIGQTYSALGDLYGGTDRSTDAEGAFRKALEVQEQLLVEYAGVSAYREMLAQTYARRASFRHGKGDLDGSRNDLRQALDLRKSLFREDPKALDNRRELGRIYRLLGRLYSRTGRHREAEEAFGQAQEIHAPLVRDYPSSFAFQYELALSYHQEGYFWWSTCQHLDPKDSQYRRAMERAEAAYRKAIPLQEQLAQERPLAHGWKFNLSMSYGGLAVVYKATGRRDQAESAFLEALRLQEAIVRRSPNETKYLSNLGATYAYLGELLDLVKQPKAKLDRLGQAIGAFEKTLEIEPGNGHARDFLPLVLRSRAKALGQLGRIGEAAVDWNREIEINPYLQDRVSKQSEHAYSRAHLGQYHRATEEADTLVPGNPQSWDVLLNLAAVYSLSAAAVLKDGKLSSVEQARLADQYSARGVGVLARAYDLGHFKDRTHLASLRDEEDLKYLRTRADFQKLLAEVEREVKKETNPSTPGVRKK